MREQYADLCGSPHGALAGVDCGSDPTQFQRSLLIVGAVGMAVIGAGAGGVEPRWCVRAVPSTCSGARVTGSCRLSRSLYGLDTIVIVVTLIAVALRFTRPRSTVLDPLAGDAAE